MCERIIVMNMMSEKLVVVLKRGGEGDCEIKYICLHQDNLALTLPNSIRNI